MKKRRPNSSGALRLLAALVASSEAAIVAITLDGTIMAWNPGAEQLFGYSSSDANGQHIRIIVPPDRLAELDDILVTIAAGKRIERHETESVRKDGQRLTISITMSPARDRRGRVVGASVIAYDEQQDQLPRGA